eukprot:10055583-Alexandrium_andersonii.AAC.1
MCIRDSCTTEDDALAHSALPTGSAWWPREARPERARSANHLETMQLHYFASFIAFVLVRVLCGCARVRACARARVRACACA